MTSFQTHKIYICAPQINIGLSAYFSSPFGVLMVEDKLLTLGLSLLNEVLIFLD